MPTAATFYYGKQWGKLSFRYDPAAVAAVKQIPGARWDKIARVWRLPTHAMPAMRTLLPSALTVSYLPEQVAMPQAIFPERVAKAFRPYQLQGASAMVSYPGFLLQFDLRTGKTLTALGATAAAFMAGTISAAVVLYPTSVKGEWLRQPRQWVGLELEALEGHTSLEPADVARVTAQPYLLIGCSYELLAKRYAEILALLRGRKFAVIADEVQNMKNRKSGRYEGGKALADSADCVHRWALTGTAMRNRPADIWAVFDFVQPGSMGTFFQFAKRYAAAQEGEFGWDYSGSSNEGELAARLGMMSLRITRQDAGAYLPPSERHTIMCSMSTADTKLYKAAEQANAGAIRKALTAPDPSAAGVAVLKQLAKVTTSSKVPVAMERIRVHLDRGVKVLVFATFHESLKALEEKLDPDTGNAPFAEPVFCAGGWMLPDKRRKLIDAWKQTPGPAVLLANTLSSGIGIDLSDADVAIYLELCWVPSDFVQSEGRIQDIHQGKRKTPPLYEYLLTKGTVDADMGLALVNKQNVINAVVGRDAESLGMTAALRESGALNSSNLSLDREDPEAVERAMDALQRRLLGEVADDESADLASRVGEAFEPEQDDESAGKAFEDDNTTYGDVGL